MPEPFKEKDSIGDNPTELSSIKLCKVRIATFNINGLRPVLNRCTWLENKTLQALFKKLNASIICFQETKIHGSQLTKDMAKVPGFHAYYTFSTEKRGYSGVSVYVKDSIRVYDAEEGLTGWLIPKPGTKPYKFRKNAYPPECYPQIKQAKGLRIDNQGRVLILKFKSVVLINVYCPADSTGQHTAYRNQFFELLDFKVRALRTRNFEVIITGDFNVVYDPKDSEKTLIEHEKFRTNDYTNDELCAWIGESSPRQIFKNWFSELNLIDCTRTFHPKRTKMYTAWDIRKNHRAINSGSRIDLVITSPGIKCTGSDILPDIDGSDHCPVYADLLLDNDPQTNHQLPLLCRVNSSVFDSNLQKYFLKSSK